MSSYMDIGLGICIHVWPISLYQPICLWSLRTYTWMHIYSPISISELMKYTQTPVLHSLDGFMLKTDQALLQETIWRSKAVWDMCYSIVGEFTYWRRYYVIIIPHHPANTLPTTQLNSVAYMVCISASFYLTCMFIQESKSTSSYSEHTTYRELPVNRYLLRL